MTNPQHEAGGLVERLTRSNTAFKVLLKDTYARAEAAEAQVVKLRAALEPFADFIPDFFDDGYQDDDIVKLESHHGDLDLTLTVEDFRRAREALSDTTSSAI